MPKFQTPIRILRQAYRKSSFDFVAAKWYSRIVHRDDGPAKIIDGGNVLKYAIQGTYHRKTGPAIIDFENMSMEVMGHRDYESVPCMVNKEKKYVDFINMNAHASKIRMSGSSISNRWWNRLLKEHHAN